MRSAGPAVISRDSNDDSEDSSMPGTTCMHRFSKRLRSFPTCAWDGGWEAVRHRRLEDKDTRMICGLLSRRSEVNLTVKTCSCRSFGCNRTRRAGLREGDYTYSYVEHSEQCRADRRNSTHLEQQFKVKPG